VLWLSGLRDRHPWTAPLFYATPPVLTCVVALAAATGCAAQRRRVLATAGLALAVVCAWTFVLESFVRGDPREVEGDLRGLLWNTQHGHRGWEQVARQVREVDPDVAWLVEGGDGSDGADELWKRELPGHHLLRMPGGFLVLARGRSEMESYHPLPARGRAAVVRHEVLGRVFRSVVCDVYGNPFHDRGPSFRRLGELVVDGDAAPELVLGDFNTPRQSWHWRAWEAQRRHVLEAVGEGYDATWPLPTPVLSLDHVWATWRVSLHRAWLGWSLASDHRPVVFEFDLPGDERPRR